MSFLKKCDICGQVTDNLKLTSDGTDSGESDWLCDDCRGGKQPESYSTRFYLQEKAGMEHMSDDNFS